MKYTAVYSTVGWSVMTGLQMEGEDHYTSGRDKVMCAQTETETDFFSSVNLISYRIPSSPSGKEELTKFFVVTCQGVGF